MKNTVKRNHTISYIFPIYYLTLFRVYIHWFHLLNKSTTWTQKERQRYQNKKLQNLIIHAHNNVPYYHNLFKSIKLNPKDIKTPKDLLPIPPLTKEMIRKNMKDLQAKNYPSTAFYKRETGGTMGNPLFFYVEKSQWLGIHLAFNRFYMKNAGYHSQDKIVSFCGIKTPVRYHRFFRTVECSAFHTSIKDFDSYNDLIHRFKPRFINTFPSIFLLFTKDLIERKKEIYQNINAIFCHGEKISPKEKQFLAETYDCEIYDQYGHREQCVFATTSKHDDSYHVYPEYGIIELIDEENNHIHQKEKTGEIIATSLTNHIFPFIRYRTGDLSSYKEDKNNCFPQSLSSINGRKNDFLIGKNEEKIPFTHLHQILSNPGFHLLEYQIIQDTKGEIYIQYVQRKNYTQPSITEIKKALREISKDQIKYTITSVDHIEKTRYGKQKYLIQNIPIHDFSKRLFP